MEKKLDLVVLSGVAVDSEENRRILGSGADLSYPRPTAGSVVRTCEQHNGPIWIGPAVVLQRNRLLQAGITPALICLTCAERMAAERNSEMRIVKVTINGS
jgi:hypothetical protein